MNEVDQWVAFRADMTSEKGPEWLQTMVDLITTGTSTDSSGTETTDWEKAWENFDKA